MGSAETGEPPVFDASIPCVWQRRKPSTQAAFLCQGHRRSTPALNFFPPRLLPYSASQHQPRKPHECDHKSRAGGYEANRSPHELFPSTRWSGS